MIEFLQQLGIILMILAFCVVAVVGSIMAAEESSQRKKNMKAGTHDYYGNKVDEHDTN